MVDIWQVFDYISTQLHYSWFLGSFGLQDVEQYHQIFNLEQGIVSAATKHEVVIPFERIG
jgi:hypothetical protein